MFAGDDVRIDAGQSDASLGHFCAVTLHAVLLKDRLDVLIKRFQVGIQIGTCRPRHAGDHSGT